MSAKGRVKWSDKNLPSLLEQIFIRPLDERSDRESEAFEALPVTCSNISLLKQAKPVHRKLPGKDHTKLHRWRQQLFLLKQQPVISGTLVIINVLVFIVCTFTGDLLYNKGGLETVSVIARNEYGRLIWSLFLHSDTHHLISNMIILFFMGAMIEKEIGHIRYAILYFLAGIGGNLLSLYMKVINGDLAMSVGASGAIFGLDGVLLAMVLFWDGGLPNVTPTRVVLMIILSLYSGFSSAGIDNAAHVGGLVTGALAGCVMCGIRRARYVQKRRN